IDVEVHGVPGPAAIGSATRPAPPGRSPAALTMIGRNRTIAQTAPRPDRRGGQGEGAPDHGRQIMTDDSGTAAGGAAAARPGIFDRDLDSNPANYTPLSSLSFLSRAATVYPH